LKSLAFEEWDGGRLVVNRGFGDVLCANGLGTFEALMHYQGGDVAKNLLRERTTTRLVLKDAAGRDRAFYLKRHGPAPWKEYVKPLLRLTRPMLGARHEWNAILRFHEAGIPTMTPVALGESGGESFLLTQGIEGCTKLSHWVEAIRAGTNGTHADHAANGCQAMLNGQSRQSREVVLSVAQIARTMHAAGLHHQDFYLTHFLVSEAGPPGELFVIDLGRARHRRRLSRRWIVKDLAQLHFSAALATKSQRARFFAAYLGRPITPRDRGLLRRIERKSRAIARHSARHGL
jgi:heptose I phosphotransferase